METDRCRYCDSVLPPHPGRGRKPHYCNAVHKQLGYMTRKALKGRLKKVLDDLLSLA